MNPWNKWADGWFSEADADQISALISVLDSYDREMSDGEVLIMLDWVRGVIPYPGGIVMLTTLLRQEIAGRSQ